MREVCKQNQTKKNQEFNNKTCNNNISTDLQTKHSFFQELLIST